MDTSTLRHFTLNNGIQIPSIGFGTYKLPDAPATSEIVCRALADGYRNIDCASYYANQSAIGHGLRESGLAREDMFISSKVWNTDRGYDTTLRSFEKTLGELGLDYLDLYLIHWPASPSQTDRWRDINRSTWKALERLVDEHSVRAIGVCNFRPRHLEALLTDANILPAVNQ
ncbi:MAG: aldo/keto reductase, partial [Muribaculaceae bacterium]|nr:aldo/keto reductase [Muribaculaceae bacterium]